MTVVRQPAEKRFKHPIGSAVHQLLWNDWDPIGVNGCGPDDEYDGYIWPVISKVMSGAGADELAEYLDWAVTVHMGLDHDPVGAHVRNLELAARLVALKPDKRVAGPETADRIRAIRERARQAGAPTLDAQRLIRELRDEE